MQGVPAYRIPRRKRRLHCQKPRECCWLTQSAPNWPTLANFATFTLIEGEDSCISRIAHELSTNGLVIGSRIRSDLEFGFAPHDGLFTIQRIIQCDVQIFIYQLVILPLEASRAPTIGSILHALCNLPDFVLLSELCGRWRRTRLRLRLIN